MKIETAIEVLTHKTLARVPLGANDQLGAVELAIEGLKRIQSKRITMSYHPDDLLPGETEK